MGSAHSALRSNEPRARRDPLKRREGYTPGRALWPGQPELAKAAHTATSGGVSSIQNAELRQSHFFLKDFFVPRHSP